MNQVQLPKTVYATFAGSIDPISLSRIFQNFGGAVTGKVETVWPAPGSEDTELAARTAYPTANPTTSPTAKTTEI
jgi:hypothetical protein